VRRRKSFSRARIARGVDRVKQFLFVPANAETTRRTDLIRKIS
jgi:hypothetical protein